LAVSKEKTIIHVACKYTSMFIIKKFDSLHEFLNEFTFKPDIMSYKNAHKIRDYA